MVFDLSGGGYTLTGIDGNPALQFDVGYVESDSPTLTVTGANTLKTTGLDAGDAATITVTGGATFEVAGTDASLFNSTVVSDGGTLALDTGLNITQYEGATASLSVDGGTVTAGADGVTFAGGTTVTVQDKGAMNVAGFAEFRHRLRHVQRRLQVDGDLGGHLRRRRNLGPRPGHVEGRGNRRHDLGRARCGR